MDEAILKKKCAFWLSDEVPTTDGRTMAEAVGEEKKERSLATSVTHLYCMDRARLEPASYRIMKQAARSHLAAHTQSESLGRE